jgi:cysteine desulfurase
VLAAFTELKNRGVVETRIAPLHKDGSVDVAKLLELIDEKTSFVSVMHVNNEVGAINDVNSIAKAVKAKNPRVIFHVDGVQAYGKLPFRLAKEIDAYSISAHKIGGLKGVGALVKRKSLVIQPYIIGGGQESGKRSGTENVFGIMQFTYAAEEKFKTMKADFERLANYRERLYSLLDKDVYTRISSENGTPYILSVSAVGLRGEILLHMANDKGLIVGTGSACSSNAKMRYSKVVLACGYDEKTADGVLRLSFSEKTTEEEIEKAAKILNEIGRDLKRRMQ